MTDEAIVQDETPVTQEAAVPETGGDNATDEGSENAQAEPEQDGAKPEDNERKAKEEEYSKRVQKRIASEVAQRRQAEERNAELERRLAEVEKKVSAPKAEKPQFPKSDDYNTTEEYQAAIAEYTDKLTDWKLDQRLTERDQKQTEAQKKQSEEATAKERAESFHKREAEFAKDKPDYDESVYEFSQVVKQLNDVNSAKITAEILAHEKGPDILYHLSKNKTAARDLYRTPAAFAADQINEIVAGFSNTAASQPNKLPPPPDPVRGSSSGVKSETQMSGRELRRKHGLI